VFDQFVRDCRSFKQLENGDWEVIIKQGGLKCLEDATISTTYTDYASNWTGV
jgi:hypothetical protein